MKAAIYARYSSDKQREASIEDQARNCRKVADREGWSIAETYSDHAISGTRSDRPAYQRMLIDAKAHQFEVLLVDDLSRLSRDQVESETAFRKLEHWGVRVIGVSDGYDSSTKTRKLQRTVKNLMNEVYLDDLAEKTHRGLEGQARKGNNTGGRAYGYKHIPIEDSTRLDNFGRPLVVAAKREVDKKQADVVRQIFESYAAGLSARMIAGELNRQNIPSPGASWKRTVRRKDKWLASAIAGDPAKGIGILNNDLYRGIYIWNRSQWVKDPENHRRVRRERPKAEWVEVEKPELRIVDDELWQRVKARQKQGASEMIKQALRKHTGRGPKYLLSGLLKCGDCGANYAVTGASQSYTCSSHTNGGKEHACANRLRVPRRVAESKLLAGLKQELLKPEYFDEFKRTVRKLMDEQQSAQSSEQNARAQRQAELKAQVSNMTDAIANGMYSPALRAKLEAAETELKALSRSRGDAALDKVATMLPRLADTYTRLVGDLEDMPDRDIARGRAALKQLLGDVRLVPVNGGLSAEISLDLFRLWSSVGKPDIIMVAGVGFEPTTFGL